MKLERVITIFDNKTEKLMREINIDHINLEQLQEIFGPSADDPLMYNVYEIQIDHVPALNRFFKDKIDFDFEANAYFVECWQLPPYDFS